MGVLPRELAAKRLKYVRGLKKRRPGQAFGGPETWTGGAEFALSKPGDFCYTDPEQTAGEGPAGYDVRRGQVVKG